MVPEIAYARRIILSHLGSSHNDQLKHRSLRRSLVQIAERGMRYLRAGPFGAVNSQAPRALQYCVDSPHKLSLRLARGRHRISGWIVSLESDAQPRIRGVLKRRIISMGAVSRPDVTRYFNGIREVGSDCGFRADVVVGTGIHRIRLEVMRDDGSWVGLRVIWLIQAPAPPAPVRRFLERRRFGAWMRLQERRYGEEQLEIQEHIRTMATKPRFLVVVDARRQRDGLARTVASIRLQCYPHLDCVILGKDQSQIDTATEDVSTVSEAESAHWLDGDFLVLLKPGEMLLAPALYEFAATLNQFPDADLIYADECAGTARGTVFGPFFKPDWSPDYLEQFNYIGMCACFRTTLVRSAGGPFERYEITLTLTEGTRHIRHIRKILGTHPARTRDTGNMAQVDFDADAQALRRRLERTGRSGAVKPGAEAKGYFDVDISLARQPLVTVLLASPRLMQGASAETRLLLEQLGTLRERTAYARIELIVVAGAEWEPAARAHLDRLGGHLVTVPGYEVNQSMALNKAVTRASGEYLVVLAAGTEVHSEQWVEAMLGHFEKPHVGVVGAKLISRDHHFTATGVIHVEGTPQLAVRRYDPLDTGYFFSACVARNYAAASAVCLMTPKTLFEQSGGFSEAFPVRYNDVDYCQRVRASGLTVLVAPDAQVSVEALSPFREVDDSADLTNYQRTWPLEAAIDPFYSEEFLTLDVPSFVPHINLRSL